MDRAKAYRRWQSLGRMTTARGCTAAEAATARRLAASLAARWGFGGAAPTPPRREYEARYERAERHAARHFLWEYRSCGKRCSTCRNGAAHGPYKYAKVRTGRTVRSVYLGR